MLRHAVGKALVQLWCAITAKLVGLGRTNTAAFTGICAKYRPRQTLVRQIVEAFTA